MAISPLTNERNILEQISQGNERAFTKLFFWYARPVAAFVQKLTGTSDLTEEIIQDVFVIIWQRRQTLQQIEHFHNYLFILCRNHTFAVLKKWRHNVFINWGLSTSNGFMPNWKHLITPQPIIVNSSTVSSKNYRSSSARLIPSAAISGLSQKVLDSFASLVAQEPGLPPEMYYMAAGRLTKAVQETPNNYVTWSILAQAYANLNEPDKAMQIQEKVIALFRNDTSKSKEEAEKDMIAKAGERLIKKLEEYKTLKEKKDILLKSLSLN